MKSLIFLTKTNHKLKLLIPQQPTARERKRERAVEEDIVLYELLVWDMPRDSASEQFWAVKPKLVFHTKMTFQCSVCL